MTSGDDRSPTDGPGPVQAQGRDEPNQDLVHRHEDDQESRDAAIIAGHQRAGDAAPVQKGQLNPPPVDEHD